MSEAKDQLRLKNKVAVIVGAGQTPGDTIGNGRATALLFARHGAKVFAVDRHIERAQETVDLITSEGGEATPFAANITHEADCAAMAEACAQVYGRIDILHNNVGIGTGDSGPVHLTEDRWDAIHETNLKGPFLVCKYVLPVMRDQGGGSIVNISSAAAVASTGMLAYKTSKAGLNALTQCIAMGNAQYGIRVNCIMPGLMNTPMAIQGRSKAQQMDPQQLIEQRDARVPLKGGMGSGWDTAYAALFLASEEAKFITGVILPVDGGQSARIG
jgi:NAD(P)-dependent dehydrogenase (short-subunit alcohol dehydrogenase family)